MRSKASKTVSILLAFLLAVSGAGAEFAVAGEEKALTEPAETEVTEVPETSEEAAAEANGAEDNQWMETLPVSGEQEIETETEQGSESETANAETEQAIPAELIPEEAPASEETVNAAEQDTESAADPENVNTNPSEPQEQAAETVPEMEEPVAETASETNEPATAAEAEQTPPTDDSDESISVDQPEPLDEIPTGTETVTTSSEAGTADLEAEATEAQAAAQSVEIADASADAGDGAPDAQSNPEPVSVSDPEANGTEPEGAVPDSGEEVVKPSDLEETHAEAERTQAPLMPETIIASESIPSEEKEEEASLPADNAEQELNPSDEPAALPDEIEAAAAVAPEAVLAAGEAVVLPEEPASDTEGKEAVSEGTVLPSEAGEIVSEACDTLSAASAEFVDVLPAASEVPTEGTEGFVYRLYEVVHQRKPDEEGFHYWVDALNSGRLTAADVVIRFFDSPEYVHSGKSKEEIVRNCYQTMLNREPDEEGFQYWKSRLDVGMTPDTLIAGFVRSPEFAGIARQYGITPGRVQVTNPLDFNYYRTYFVYRLYQNCLGREPDREGQTYWCRRLAEGLTGVEIAQRFVFSEESGWNRYDNHDFTEMLYRTIHGRGYDQEGLNYWVNKLNYTFSRERVVNKFALSPEFAEQCRVASIDVGTAAAEPDNGTEWQYNIEVLRLCNNYRRSAGLPDLYTREDLLWELATLRAGEIEDYFSHTRPDGTSCFSLFTKQGFYGYLGENLAGGYETPAEVVDAWMKSEGHRANIYSKNYTYLATGFQYAPDKATYCAEGAYAGRYVNFKNYWAQSFCNFGVKIK